MKIEHIKLEDLRPYGKNARTHSQKQIDLLAKNIERFGFTVPLLIDDQNEIIAGHGRLMALKQLNRTEAPCVRMDGLSKTEIKALRISDNKLAEMAEWDMGLLLPELKELPEDEFDLTGFDKDLLIEPDEKDDEVPAVPDAPKSVIGDLYELGRHRLLCGDSTQPDAVKRLMDGKKADMVFTDPPYNVDYTGMQNSKQWDGIRNDNMSDSSFKKFLIDSFKNVFANTKGEAAFYICHADKTHTEFREAFESVGYEWRATIIWVKNSPAFNFAQYKYAHEPIFYCFKKGKTVSWYGDLTRKTVWHEEWDTNKIVNWYKAMIKLDKVQAKTTIWEAKKEHGDHPTIKPVELIIKAIKNSSKQDDLLFEPFAGSGSTLIAGEKTGRICYGMELDPKYVDVIVQRYVDYVDNPVVKCNGQDITQLWKKSNKTKVKTKGGQI